MSKSKYIGIDWEAIEEHGDIMDRAHKADKADEIVGIKLWELLLKIRVYLY